MNRVFSTLLSEHLFLLDRFFRFGLAISIFSAIGSITLDYQYVILRPPGAFSSPKLDKQKKLVGKQLP